jgi:hypothetical protein
MDGKYAALLAKKNVRLYQVMTQLFETTILNILYLI